jgi:hypothetical protein
LESTIRAGQWYSIDHTVSGSPLFAQPEGVAMPRSAETTGAPCFLEAYACATSPG